MMFFIVLKHMTINLKLAIVTSCKSDFYSNTKPWDVKLPEHLRNKVVKIAYICVILKNMADETQLICGPSATLMCVREREKVCVLPGCVLRCLQVVWTDWLPATGDYCLLHTSSRSSARLHTNTHTQINSTVYIVSHMQLSRVIRWYFTVKCHSWPADCFNMVDSWVPLKTRLLCQDTKIPTYWNNDWVYSCSDRPVIFILPLHNCEIKGRKLRMLPHTKGKSWVRVNFSARHL